MLRDLGVDRIEVLDFTRSFAALSAEQYLREILRDRFGVTTLLMGYDNRLGSDRLTADKLRPIADAISVELIELEPFGQAEGGHRFPDVHPDLTPVSSTKIRKALEEGDIASASEMLGYG